MRTFLIFFLSLLILAAAGLLAWISHQPNHPRLVQAEDWPVVGPVVLTLREAYRPLETVWVGGPKVSRMTREAGRVMPRRPTWQGEPGFVWVQPGTLVRTEPSGDARQLHRIDAIANLAKIERRGDWYRVWRFDIEGWVHLPGYREAEDPPWGEEPEPPVPLAPVAPDADLLADALARMDENDILETRFGPYLAYTDFEDEELFALLSAVAEQLEPLWTQRHGLRPLGEPLSVVVLYRHEASYRGLERASDELRGLDAEGFAGYGLAVTYVGHKKVHEVASTLVHELCHRIHRRALGPALPPWLEEGLADDLALSRLDGHRLDPTGYSGRRTTTPGNGGVQIRFGQGLAALWTVRQEILRGRLPLLSELADLDHDEFLATQGTRLGTESRRLRYATMALWVRYLVSGDHGRHRAGWHIFLRRIAEGGPVTADALEGAIGVPTDQLEADFRTWVYKESRAIVGD